MARYAVLTVHAGTQRCIGHAESLREGESQCLRLLLCLCLTLRTRIRASPGRFWILRRTAMLRCSWGCKTRTASSTTSHFARSCSIAWPPRKSPYRRLRGVLAVFWQVPRQSTRSEEHTSELQSL